MKKYENLNMIVCIAEDNLIGDANPDGNGLLWHIKEELLYFKSITLGHTLLFGRNTANFVPINLMKKNREVIILRSDMDIPKLLDELEKENKKVFVCGGKTIYEYFLNNFEFNEIYLSKIKSHVEVAPSTKPLYLPKIEDYGYKIQKETDYYDFVAYVYKK